MTNENEVTRREQSDVESAPSDSCPKVAPNDDEQENVLALLCKILDELTEKARRDSAKDILISRVVERLDELERDFLFREFRQPIFQDLMLLCDRAATLSAQFEDDAAATTALESIERELLEILRRQGVTPIEVSGTAFNPNLQEALAVESTDNPAMESAVLEVRRRGFAFRGTVIRPQGVMVAKHIKEVAEDE